MTDRGSRVVQMPLGRDRKKSQSQSQSESSHTNANRYHKPSLASLNPDTFVPPFDVLNELAHNKEEYIGDQPISIYSFPDHLRTSLDRIRARVITASKPGRSTTITCCMSYGLSLLHAHEDVQALLNLKKEFDLTECEDSWLVEELASAFRHFALSLPDLSLSQSRRLNITLTKSVQSQITDLIESLGANLTSIVVLSIMATLIDQPCIAEERRKSMEQTCSLFLRKAQIRRLVIEALMRTIR